MSSHGSVYHPIFGTFGDFWQGLTLRQRRWVIRGAKYRHCTKEEFCIEVKIPADEDLEHMDLEDE